MGGKVQLAGSSLAVVVVVEGVVFREYYYYLTILVPLHMHLHMYMHLLLVGSLELKIPHDFYPICCRIQ